MTSNGLDGSAFSPQTQPISSPPFDAGSQAVALIAGNHLPDSSRIDTQALASQVYSLAQRDLPAAQQLYTEVRTALEQVASPMEAAHFRLDFEAHLSCQASFTVKEFLGLEAIPKGISDNVLLSATSPAHDSASEPDSGFGVDDGASLALDAVPFVGTGKSALELLSGKDPVTGEPVSRWLSAAGLLAGVVPGGKALLKGGSEAVEQVVKNGDEVAQSTTKIADDAADVSPVTPAPGKVLDIPQGLSRAQFEDLSVVVRSKAQELDLGDDIFVQGSRAGGTAKATSDIDIAIRLTPEQFDDYLYSHSRLSNVNPGSAKEKTLMHAIDTGKIQSGEARLSPLRKQLEENLGMEVDLSIVRAGGKFDNGPQLPLLKSE